MSREEKNSLMLSLVDQWQHSDMSQAEFANSNNINLHTFKYWITKSRQVDVAGSSFIQLGDATGSAICVRYPNGVELLLPVHTPVHLIKGLVQL